MGEHADTETSGKAGLVFICTNYNKYSFAALAGALENLPETRNVPIAYIQPGDLAKLEANLVFSDLSDPFDKHETVERIMICFSFTTINLVDIDRQVKLVKRIAANTNKDFLLVAGGPHTSGDPFGTLKLGFDIAVMGEAEETFPELIASFSKYGASFDSDSNRRNINIRETARNTNTNCKPANYYKSIKGLAYIDPYAGAKDNNSESDILKRAKSAASNPILKNALARTGRRQPINLNSFAPFSLQSGKLSPIEISRGCPHACRFCQTSFLFGSRMRHRDIDQIVKYVRLSKENGTKDFRFISPNALAYGSRDGRSVDFYAIETLLEKVATVTGKRHLFFGSFPSEIRPEAISARALELITSYTGTKQLVIGAQSGSRRMLDILHREHTIEDVDNAVQLALDAGLKISVDFIFGLPEETGEDRALSIEKMDELASKGACIHSHTFIPLPGTPLANAKPGVIDKDLAAHLGKLANKGLQFGQWKKQQQMAGESLSLVSMSTED